MVSVPVDAGRIPAYGGGTVDEMVWAHATDVWKGQGRDVGDEAFPEFYGKFKRTYDVLTSRSSYLGTAALHLVNVLVSSGLVPMAAPDEEGAAEHILALASALRGGILATSAALMSVPELLPTNEQMQGDDRWMAWQTVEVPAVIVTQ